MAESLRFDLLANDRASAVFDKVGKSASDTESRFSKVSGGLATFGKVAAVGMAAAGAAAGFLGVKAVGLEADFSKTMNVLQATTGAPEKAMKSLSALAMKMGADTVFSASDASRAMLELARGGISAATIKAGALAGTMTLAAAGELEMGEAANIAVKSMGQFNIKGKDMASVAAALAGGANASSASVRDMSQALAQGGLAANSVGFSIQEATGILAAFSNSGLEGSDAGTSLKTMLDRLQPTTQSAKSAMMMLGAWTDETGSAFVRANGEFKSAAEIADILAKGTENLSGAEQKRLITQAFGSDAQRAATIFAKEGAAGLEKMTKATSDQSAAEEAAAAQMKGTAGAMEAMKGSIETAGLAFGLAIAPVVQFGAGIVSNIANGAVPIITNFGAAAGKILQGLTDAFKGGGLSGAVDFVGQKISTMLPIIQAKLTEWGGAFIAWIGPMIPPMLAKLGELSERLFAWVGKNLPKWVENLTQWGEALIEWITPMIPPMLVAMGKILLRLTGWVIREGIPMLSKSLDRLGAAAIRGLIQGIGGMFGDLGAKMDATKDRITNKFLSAPSMLLGEGRQVLGGLIGGIGERLADLGAKISAAKERIVSKFVGAAEWLAGEGGQIVGGLIGGIGGRVADLGAKVGDIKTKITGAFSGAATMLSSIGGDIVQGLVNGITGAASRVASAVSALVAKIPGPIRKIMGIASPSKVMAKIGEQIGDGLAVGMNDSQRAVSRAAGDMLGVAGVDGSSALTLSSGGGGIAGSRGGGVTLNVTINGGGDPNAVVAQLHAYVKRNGLIRNIAAA